MHYYEVSLLKSPLNLLTYESIIPLKIGRKIGVNLARRKNLSDAVIINEVNKPTFKCVDIKDVYPLFYDEKMLEIAKFISSYYVCSIGEALSIYIPFEDSSNEIPLITYDKSNEITLSSKQNELYNFTIKNKTSLLFSSTSSGKTEIYMKAIHEILLLNKQAIMLMPEISLTPQMQKRLEVVFGNCVAIWHSKITKKKKSLILEGLKDGTIKLIAGARSSLFLPYKNLGIIIVDEEHDESYKADKKPRINVKDIAILMGKRFDIKVILGSATPSLGSYTKIPYIRNKITFFDTSKTILYDESTLGLNEIILNKMQAVLNNNKQVIVFLPTRANFKYQVCSDCGKSQECPYCSVSLSLHKTNKALVCHYCNYTQAIQTTCPSCHTGIIKNYRVGTAEIQLQLQEYFQDKIIEKFDRDSIKTTKELKKVLKNFNDNKIDILVGTQMLSKGHDYHNVTLAVILGIDSVLNMTSYKSREKALSLALQIAGRSGRKGVGEVLLQTKNKDFFNNYMINDNYEEFLNDEMECRVNMYPPYVKLAKVTFIHQNSSLALKELNIWVSKFTTLTNDVELVGFGESAIFKIANKYRYELLLRSSNVKALLNTLHSINSPIASIDMDTLY